jgi:hypothetical protein
MLLLIDTRNPPPDGTPERPAWEPNWPFWRLVGLTTVLFVLSNALTGIVAYALVLAAFGCSCRAVAVILPPLDGLREYRQ